MATRARAKEEDCPQVDVDMPHAKRRVTFSTPPVGTGVSQAWGVETWTVASSAESAETRLNMWTSQEKIKRARSSWVSPQPCLKDT